MTSLNLLGQTIDGFEILSEIGRGGMAVVYRARQQMPSRYVALKVLPPEFGRDANYIARFRQEADSAAALEHPHIVPIYAFGSADGLHYIAMKLVSGRTLKSLIDAQGAMNVEDTIVVLEQIADALDYAHRSGVIHRDIKPSNVMLDDGGWVYLTDFGLARGLTSSLLTQTGTVMGTPAYMSPEQAEGRVHIGPASDIYSFGVIIYEMLTGQMPFEAETSQGVLVARLYQPPRSPRLLRPDLSPEVESIVLRALARQPEDRFATARELVAALRDAEHIAAADARPAVGYAPTPSADASPTMAMPTTRPISPSPTPVPPPRVAAPEPQPTPAPTRMPHHGPPTPMPRPHGPPLHAMPNTGPTMALPNMGETMSLGHQHAGQMPIPRRKKGWRGCLIGCAIVGVLMLAGAAGGSYLVYRYGVPITQANDARESLANTGDLKASISTVERLLGENPNVDEAKQYLALMYLLDGRPTESEHLATSLANASVFPPLPRVVLAMAEAERGAYDQAMNDINEAIGHSGDYALAYAVRASVNADMGAARSDKDLLERALHDLDQANAHMSDDDALDRALIHAAAAHVHRQHYELTDDAADLTRAIDEIKQAVSLQPNMAYFHTEMGYLYDTQGDHSQAKQEFTNALAKDKDYVRARVGLGWNAYSSKDAEEAVRIFDEVIKLRSDDADAHLGKSYALAALKDADYKGALAEARLAAGLAPERLDVQSELGWAFRNLGNNATDEAERKANYNDAERQFRHVLSINDRFFDAYLGLGWVLQDIGTLSSDDEKLRGSVDALDKALDLKKDQRFALNARGWSNYHLAAYQDALDDFDAAIQGDSAYADALYGKGSTLAALGRTDEAKDAFTSAAAAGSTGAQDKLDELKK